MPDSDASGSDVPRRDGESVVIPGGRDVRGTLEEPRASDASTCVVACPPHPRGGGDRRDPRLRAIADAIVTEGVACLRIDYGPWDEGRGERRDVELSVTWAGERFERVALLGYSFGAALALVVATDADVASVSALAPPARVASLDALGALDRIDVPCQVIAGSRDSTVDWEPVVERARERGFDVASVDDDHHFRRSLGGIADTVASFLSTSLP